MNQDSLEFMPSDQTPGHNPTEGTFKIVDSILIWLDTSSLTTDIDPKHPPVVGLRVRSHYTLSASLYALRVLCGLGSATHTHTHTHTHIYIYIYIYIYNIYIYIHTYIDPSDRDWSFTCSLIARFHGLLLTFLHLCRAAISRNAFSSCWLVADSSRLLVCSDLFLEVPTYNMT